MRFLESRRPLGQHGNLKGISYTDKHLRIRGARQAAADAENIQAIRLLVLREAGELVDELGRAGGSRVERVDTLFDILNGEVPDTHGWLTWVYPEEAHLRQKAASAVAR